MKYDWNTAEAWSKTGAALLGGGLLTVAFCVLCGLWLPTEGEVGTATGVLLSFPVWVGAMCYAVLARTALRAWIVLGSITLLLAGLGGVAPYLW